MTESTCIFCRIAAGELPAHRVFESDAILAFLDIAPIVKGHVLVIPKAHHDPLPDLPHSLLHGAIETAQRITRAMLEGLGADGVNVTQANRPIAGQTVMHVHFHVIPRFMNDPHEWRNPQRRYGSDEEMAATAARLRAALAQLA